MLLENYLEKIQKYDFYDITYESYCVLIDISFSDNLSENIFDKIKQMRLPRELIRVFKDFTTEIKSLVSQFKINTSDLLLAFKQKDMFNILKAFGFNIKLIFRSIVEVSNLVRNGLFEIFKSIYQTKAIQKIKQGTLKIDAFLDKYPLLKKVGGVAIAGLLLYLWLNMTFIGNLDYDFNFTDVVAALKGSFSITNLFVSPEGLMLVGLFGTGAVFGLSLPWLGKTIYNLMLAIFYTIYFKYKNQNLSFKEIAEKIKKKLKIEKV